MVFYSGTFVLQIAFGANRGIAYRFNTAAWSSSNWSDWFYSGNYNHALVTWSDRILTVGTPYTLSTSDITGYLSYVIALEYSGKQAYYKLYKYNMSPRSDISTTISVNNGNTSTDIIIKSTNSTTLSITQVSSLGNEGADKIKVKCI